MKKTIFILLLTAITYCTNAQRSIAKLDTSLLLVKDASKAYTYPSAYCVVQSLNINNYQMYTQSGASGDSLSITAVVMLFANKAAYDSSKQSLSTISINTKYPNKGLPTHQQIKTKIYATLKEQ